MNAYIQNRLQQYLLSKAGLEEDTFVISLNIHYYLECTSVLDVQTQSLKDKMVSVDIIHYTPGQDVAQSNIRISAQELEEALEAAMKEKDEKRYYNIHP